MKLRHFLLGNLIGVLIVVACIFLLSGCVQKARHHPGTGERPTEYYDKENGLFCYYWDAPPNSCLD